MDARGNLPHTERMFDGTTNGQETKQRNGRFSFSPSAAATSPFPSSTSEPPNYEDDYGRKQQLPDSGVDCRVSGGPFTHRRDTRNSVCGTAMANYPAKDSAFSDSFVCAAARKRRTNATAPPHLRSYYSQENISTWANWKCEAVNGRGQKLDVTGENVPVDNRCKSFSPGVCPQQLSSGDRHQTNNDGTHSTPSHFAGAMIMEPITSHATPAGAEIEINNANDGDKEQPSIEHQEIQCVPSDTIRTCRDGRPIGQAPMIVTGLNRPSDQSSPSGSRTRAARRRGGRKIETEEKREEEQGLESLDSRTPQLVDERPESRDGTSSISEESTANFPSATSEPPTAQPPPLSNSNQANLSHSRVSLCVNPLPEILEHSVITSLPVTPTATISTQCGGLRSIVSDRSSSWFSIPWASLRTGAISNMARAISCDCTADAGYTDSKLWPKDIHHLSNLHRVTELAGYFEKGNADHIGPLKLYHAQVYKRELAKICAENVGSVREKAHRFESGQVYIRSSPLTTSTINRADAARYQRLQRATESSDGVQCSESGIAPTWSSEASMGRLVVSAAVKAQRISFSKTTLPSTSEPNLHAGFSNLRSRGVTDHESETGVREKRQVRRSHRIPYIGTASASTRDIMSSHYAPACGASSSRDEAAPTCDDAMISDNQRRCDQEGQLGASGRPNGRVSQSSTKVDVAQDALPSPSGVPVKVGVSGQERRQKYATSPGQGTGLSRLQIPEHLERKQSSGSSLSVTPTPTPSPTSSAKHARLQRFMNIFTGDNQGLGSCSDGCAPEPGSSTSLSSCYTGVSSISNQPNTIGKEGNRPSAVTTFSSAATIEGPLSHKQLVSLATGGRKRVTGRQWKDHWAILHGCTLYLCQERPTTKYRSETSLTDQAVTCYGLSESTLCIDVESCIADIAYDYVKRKNIFRVTTQRQTEHLFQANDSQTMIRWIECLQRCSLHENQLDGISNSMALIIKRYEAQSQSVSPSVKQRRAVGVGGMKTQSSLSPNGQQGGAGQCEIDGAKHSLDITSTASPNKTHSSGPNSSSAGKSERMEKGDHTPGKTRKWRRVRKSGSCPVPSPRAAESTPNPDAMFGAKLEECPTTGDDDFVPLIVQLCIKVVESQGLEAVGVYRIPGNTAAVNSLITTLDKGFENANFNDSRWRDVNVVSSLLKAYFRKLPDPLLTDRLYQQFIDAIRIENHAQKMKKIRSLIEKLPRPNYETLKYLIFHLKRVVIHSGINKMEAKNLALMFGPSLVRPCGDSSMTTMVTHMSDQCKIVELLINYCDWIFTPSSKVGDSPQHSTVPTAVTAAREESVLVFDPSSGDVSGLLKRVKTTEDDLERSKDTIVKSILNVRRGSRKSSKGRLASPESSGSVDSPISTQPPTFSSSGSVTAKSIINGHRNYHTDQVPASPTHRAFNERNIDEAIECRQQRTPSKSSKGVSTVAHSGSSAGTPDSGMQHGASADGRTSRVGSDEMHRDNIYAARRIFIVGTEGNAILQRTPPIDTVAKMDVLVQHSRHLNVNPHSLDILSPETREKIRRLQTDSKVLRSREHWQTQQLKKLANERQRIELAWERAKQDYEQEDLLDTLADNLRSGLSFVGAASNPHLPMANADALSTSSDYSTTSSIMVGSDIFGDRRRRQQAMGQIQQQRIMSVSCTGALGVEDTSSSDPSPNSCHPIEPELSTSASRIIDTDVSGGRVETPVDQPHQQQHNQRHPYDRSRLKHVAPETRFHTKPPSSDQPPPYVRPSQEENTPCQPPTVQNQKRWYDELTDDQIRTISSGQAAPAPALPNYSHYQSGENAVDQNANDLKSAVAVATKSNSGAPADSAIGKRSRILSPAERGTSRISQKIKFRSKSSSGEKRKDNRRHTVTDMETIKNVLFGGGSSPRNRESARETTPNVDSNAKLTSVGKQSRTGKLKAWFKESFRKSSPDLCEAEDGEEEENGEKTAN